MGIVDEARKRIEAILEGKEDERLMGKKKKTNAVVREAENKEKEIGTKKEIGAKKEEWYGIHVSGEIHGKRIVESLGLIGVVAEIDRADLIDMFKLKDQEDLWDEAIEKLKGELKQKALSIGANAVISVKITLGSEGYFASGSGSNDLRALIYGEAVIVE